MFTLTMLWLSTVRKEGKKEKERVRREGERKRKRESEEREGEGRKKLHEMTVCYL